MNHYVTHHFAHVETLDRAERWLLQRGFRPTQIEVHREGVPWISVLCSPDREAEAAMIFEAAEASDPDGWPSFWDLSRMPHPHSEPAEAATATSVVTARPSPIGWHPPDVNVASEADYGATQVWDVSTRFGRLGAGTPLR
jgi:hypothetical protein